MGTCVFTFLLTLFLSTTSESGLKRRYLLDHNIDGHVGRCALNPCMIDGSCALPGKQPDSNYTCHCIDVHNAHECNTATGNCLKYQCHHGGNCMSDGDRVYCHGCNHPWHGDDCGTALPEYHCSDTPCLNGGTCHPHDPIKRDHPEHGTPHPYDKPHVDHFICQCAQHWTGVHCEIDVHVGRCALNPCMIDGTCTLPENQPDSNYTCHCIDDHNALECNRATGNCLQHHCYHVGHCRSDGDRVFCHGCHHPWHGDDCGTAEKCNQLSCIHGDCLEHVEQNKQYVRCHCRSGWTGFDCSTDVDECSLNNTCQNGGHCTNTQGNYTCTCDGGWTGGQCKTSLLVVPTKPPHGFNTDVDECLPNNPCQNGGNCTNILGHYTCKCDAGWTGDNCQTDMFPKCNHTCSLDAVILSKPVVNVKTDCSGTSTFASNEALPEVCCNMRAHSDWQHGEQVQTDGSCIDGKIAPYTPIAAVNGTGYSNAGIFYGCIRNGTSGFMIIRQNCTTLPQLMTVDFASDPDNYYVIY